MSKLDEILGWLQSQGGKLKPPSPNRIEVHPDVAERNLTARLKAMQEVEAKKAAQNLDDGDSLATLAYLHGTASFDQAPPAPPPPVVNTPPPQPVVASPVVPESVTTAEEAASMLPESPGPVAPVQPPQAVKPRPVYTPSAALEALAVYAKDDAKVDMKKLASGASNHAYVERQRILDHLLKTSPDVAEGALKTLGHGLSRPDRAALRAYFEKASPKQVPPTPTPTVVTPPPPAPTQASTVSRPKPSPERYEHSVSYDDGGSDPFWYIRK